MLTSFLFSMFRRACRAGNIAVFAALSVLTVPVSFGQDELKADDLRSLIVNGGFEESQITPWEVKAENADAAKLELDETVHLEGGQAARLEFSPDASDIVVVEQRFNVQDSEVAKGPFRVKASCKIKNPPGGKSDYLFGVSFSVAYEDGSTKWESGFADSFFDRTSSDWQTVDFLWTPEKAVSSVSLRLVFPPEVVMAWVDEVAIIPLKE